jgi:diadenosine tetraphosphatase ApaH/serine/threonine PP2A family protein phosphatase
MLVAVLADLHANIQAFDAVWTSVCALRPDCVVLLGDIVGYNAAPSECIALARQCSQFVVIGNHDHDAVNEPTALGTGSAARQVQQWTRQAISSQDAEYLRGLPKIVRVEQEFLAVHGCYLNDTHYTGYVTSTMLDANLRAIAERWDVPLAFCGHTHVPMAGWLDGDDCVEQPLRELTRWPTKARAVLINPGAVGQPRDGDPRAAFALVNTERRTIDVRRVEYDVSAACQASAAAGLLPALAERLRTGR